jgi:predicted amidophosphoribosyltransferase
MEKARQANKQATFEEVKAEQADLSQPIVGVCLNCKTPKRANERHCKACGYPW